MYLVIGCNPSTADDKTDDPTIRRLINMAEHKGYGGLFMGNLFAYRETNPALMKAKATAAGFDYVIGPNNDWALENMADQASAVVFAYGKIAMEGWGGRVKNDLAKLQAMKVFEMMKAKKGIVWAFNITIKNYPQHPLYIGDLNNILWNIFSL